MPHGAGLSGYFTSVRDNYCTCFTGLETEAQGHRYVLEITTPLIRKDEMVQPDQSDSQTHTLNHDAVTKTTQAE